MTAADILAATDRPLRLRMRPDVSVHPQDSGGSGGWVLKDPLTLRYFQLRDEELVVLRMLDGRTSLSAIQRTFAQRFAPLQLLPEQLLAFLSRLYQSGLLISDAPGQGRQLWEAHRRSRRRAWLAFVANLLAIRVGAVDPEPWLRRLAPKFAWLFSGWFLTICGLLVVSAAGLAVVQFETLQARWPGLDTFLSPRNLLWLAVALAAAKCLHELGHALTCRHFGGECHEIGLLLLAFTPCLYCNVSDAWLFPSRWQRIAVSLAGIIVEMVLAAVGFLLWWWTVPGPVHAVLLNVVILCSVNTVLLNGNPLLRYDGYYVLADLLGVPNLAQQSRGLMVGFLRRRFLVGEPPEDRSLPETRRGWLMLYAAASAVYRWVVIATVLYLGYRLAKLYDVEVLGSFVVLLVAGGMILAPVVGAARFLSHPGQRRRIRRGRVGGATLVGLALLAAALFVPLPYRVVTSAVLQPENARRVYVTVPGQLVRSVAAGTTVVRDQELACLVNRDLERDVAAYTSQRNVQRLQLENLRTRQSEDPAASARIPGAESALEDLEQRLQQRLRDTERLVLRAPSDGVVIPPPSAERTAYRAGTLPTRTGTPLDLRAWGAYLEVGTLLCLIGDPDRLEALLVIDQADVQFVRTGQPVSLHLDALPSQVLRGTVVDLAKVDLKVAPRELAEESDLLVRYDREGLPRPVRPCYQARVTLDGQGHLVTVGARGRAKIRVAPQPLASRLYRTVRSQFSFEL